MIDRQFKTESTIQGAAFLDQKISILNVYASEMGQAPFPRSAEVIRALAAWRGFSAGCLAAEAFLLLKEVQL